MGDCDIHCDGGQLLGPRSWLRVLLAVVSGLLLSAMPQGADDSDPRAAALAAIRAEIGRLETRLNAMRTEESSLEARLERTEVELDLQQGQLAEASAALELAEARADAADERILVLEADLAGSREDLRRRLAGLYRLRHGYLRLLLSLEPDRALLPAVRQLRFLAQRDQRLLVNFRATRDALDIERETLAVQRREIASWQEQEAARHQALITLRRKQSHLLADVSRRRAALASRAETLIEKARKLSTFMSALTGTGHVLLDGRPMQDFEGVVDWPVAGSVAVPFGPRRDPRYKTEVPHHGVDLRVDTGTGSTVRAVYPGEVLFAGPFEGYGDMVVVHHPGRVFSLYAGLSTIDVERGATVALGGALGTSAETLYFEIRRENQPEDPTRWLR